MLKSQIVSRGEKNIATSVQVYAWRYIVHNQNSDSQTSAYLSNTDKTTDGIYKQKKTENEYTYERITHVLTLEISVQKQLTFWNR